MPPILCCFEAPWNIDAGVIGAPGITGCRGVGNGDDDSADDVAVVVDLNASADCSFSLFVGLLGTEEVNGLVIVAGLCTVDRLKFGFAVDCGSDVGKTGVMPPGLAGKSTVIH